MAEVNLNAAARNESMGKNEDNLLADGRYILTAKRNETYSCDFGGDCGLYAVCSAQDGADGEAAATAVIKALSKKREQLLQAEEAEKKVLFSDLLTQVNGEISQKGFQSKISICLLLASHGRASFYASGDCGLFLLRGKRFTCLHGLDEKKIFFGEHALLPLGSQQSFSLQQGDRFFLLGKGMIQALDIPMLHTIAARSEEPLQLVRDLVNEAMRREIGRSATAMVVCCTVRETLPFLNSPVPPAQVSGKRAQTETQNTREHRKVHMTQSTKIIAFSVAAVLVACAGLVAMSSLIQRDKQARLAEKNATNIPYAASTLPEDNQYGAVILPSTTLPPATEKTTQAQRSTTRRRKAATRVPASQTTTRKKEVSETAKPTVPPTQAPTSPPATRPVTTNPSPEESTTESPRP